MLKQIAIKNPGCQFCRYHVPQFEHKGKLTTEACIKNARKVFQQDIPKGQKRKWMWNGCAYAKEKNWDRLCRDFQIHSTMYNLINKLSLVLMNAGNQEPPTFSGEIWWDT